MKRFWKITLFLFLFSVTLGGAMLEAAPQRLRSVWANGIRYLDLSDAVAAYGGSISGGSTQSVATVGKRRLVFYPDKRYAMFDGMRVNLCSPLLARGGRVYLGQLDHANVLVPFLGSGKRYRHPVTKIVLDPGHGGRDQGTAGSRLLEKAVTLNLSNRVAKILRAYGYKVELTRTRDTALSLDERSAYANRTGADLFISIHANASSDRTVRGIETFCMTPEGAASSNSGKPDSRRYPGNANNEQNFLLAYNVQRALLGRTGAEDSGVKFARFAVLRGVNCPGVLIEVGFLSNRSDEANLGSAAYLDKLARGIASGILNYHRSLSK